MVSLTHATEVVASVVHTLTSLSVIVSHLATNDPLGAMNVVAVGCLCLVVVTLVGSACEVIRWKVRQYIRNRELTETKPGARKPKG